MTGRISERGGGAAEDRFFSFRALPREDDQPAMANHSSYFLFHACGGWMDVERRLTWKSNRLSGMQSEYIHCCPSLLLAHSGHPSPPSPLLFPFTPLHGSPQGPVNLTSPDVKFWLIECKPDSSNNGLPPGLPPRIFLGRQVAVSDRTVVTRCGIVSNGVVTTL